MKVKTDQDIIKGYLEDSSHLTGGKAEGVYLPESEKDIREIITQHNSNKKSLTVTAAQTGTTGGCIPFGGFLVSTEKLKKIIEVNEKEKFAIIEPGVTLDEISRATTLLYPPDPTEKSATIGGNVSTNASGGRGYRFGSTRNWIRRLKIITGTGKVLNIKRGELCQNCPTYIMPTTKNAAGYFAKPGMDLIDLFIGSEGTLGIVTEVEIALRPALKETFDLVAFFPSEELAIDFVQESKNKQHLPVNFFEYFDTGTLEMLKESYPHIPDHAKAAIYIEQEILSDDYLETWPGLLEKFKASIDDCWLGMDDNKKEELQKFRHAAPEHINELYKKYKSIKLATDIAVPNDKFKEMYNFYNSELETHNPKLFYIKFGHIGENHLHVNLLPKDEAQVITARDIIFKFAKKAVGLGGTVSAEHGIGKIKHQYLNIMYGQTGIEEMKKMKRQFDPNYILNPNNIFPLT